MDSQLIEELTGLLYRQRSSLLESTTAETRETTAVDERESEIEESAQIDRITQLKNRLDERGQVMIREIEAALERDAYGTYGLCRGCGEKSAAPRLRVLPTATLCIDCATALEKKRSAAAEDKAERLAIAYEQFEDSSYAKEEGA